MNRQEFLSNITKLPCYIQNTSIVCVATVIVTSTVTALVMATIMVIARVIAQAKVIVIGHSHG